MKRLIVRVKDKTKVHNLETYCHIVYTSKFLNIIGVEISEKNIIKLMKDPNVISVNESEEGKFQLNTVSA